MKLILILFAAGLVLATEHPAWAQDDGKGKDKKEYDKGKKEYDKGKGRDYDKDRDDDKDRDKDRDEDYKDRDKERDKDYKDREKDQREYDKERSGKAYEAREKRNQRVYGDRKDRENDRYPTTKPTTRSKVGEILGKVILPPASSSNAPAPRRLEGVPRGQYPPPGQCRIWYPDRPAGHQPSPKSCESLRGARLERGAFILHGDQAYDADYDWQAEEKRKPGTVARDVFDILFPNRR